MAFERRPAALEQQIVRAHGVRLCRVDDHEVGGVAFAEVAAVLHAEERRRRMAGAFDDRLERQHALLPEVQEHEQRVLDERKAGGRLEVGLGLLLARVRGVVGGDDVDHARGHGGAHGGAVRGGLHGRVALDLVAQAGVVLLGEPEVVHAGLGGEALALERRGREERELLGRRDVEDVQARVMALGQGGGHGRRRVAGVGGADARVFAGGDVFAPLRLGGGFGGLDHGRVLAVRGDQGGGVPEDAFERLLAVDQHVAGGRPHEDLHPADPLRVDGLDEFEVGVGRPEEEGVVGDGRLRRARELGLQGLERRGRRVRVRHLHEGGHAPGDGRAGLAGDGGLMRQAGLAEVHLVVDQPGQQELALEVELAVGAGPGGDRANAFDQAGAEEDVGLEATAFVDEFGVAEDDGSHARIFAGIGPPLQRETSLTGSAG